MNASRYPFRLSWIRIVEMILLVAMFAAGAYFYAALPERMPSHWSAAGVVDGYMTKQFGAWFTPGIAVILAIFLPLIATLDPKKENYAMFDHAWQMIQLIMVSFFAYVYALQLYASLHPEWTLFSNCLMAGLGLMFAALGYFFRDVRHNYFVGIRTPWTLADEDVWDRTHKFGGNLWVAMGALLFVWAASGNAHVFLGFMLFVLVAVITPIVFSYVIYRNKHHS